MELPGAMSDDELPAYSRGLLERVSVHAEAFVAEGRTVRGRAPRVPKTNALRWRDVGRAAGPRRPGVVRARSDRNLRPCHSGLAAMFGVALRLRSGLAPLK